MSYSILDENVFPIYLDTYHQTIIFNSINDIDNFFKKRFIESKNICFDKFFTKENNILVLYTQFHLKVNSKIIICQKYINRFSFLFSDLKIKNIDKEKKVIETAIIFHTQCLNNLNSYIENLEKFKLGNLKEAPTYNKLNIK